MICKNSTIASATANDERLWLLNPKGKMMRNLLLIAALAAGLYGCAQNRTIWNTNGKMDANGRKVWDTNGKMNESNRKIWDTNGKIENKDRKIWVNSEGEPVIK